MNLLKSIVVVVAAVAILLIARWLFGTAQLPQRPPMGPPLVVPHTVTVRPFAERIESIGTVYANESVTITAPVSERVAQIRFSENATVKAGELLVQLENGEEQADLAEAEITVAQAQRDFERIKALRAKQVVAEQEFDTQRSALDAAVARLTAARVRFSDRAITAPFAGVLGLRRVSQGALVAPGSVITTLDDLSVIKAEFSVPETFLAALTPGQKVTAHSIAWPDAVFEGTVSVINTRVDPATRAVSLQAKIPNPDGRLRQGMLLTVELRAHDRTSVAVPEQALVAYGEKQFVFVIKAGATPPTAAQREVKLGVRETGWVEITSGLAEKELIVLEGVMLLRDGAPIKLPENAAPATQK